MSKGKAIEIRRWVSHTGADARLYRLIHPAPSPPVEGVLGDEDAFGECIQYVVVSAVTNAWTSNPGETFIFPSDASGKITDWGELPGSLSDEINHSKALETAGYEIEQTPDPPHDGHGLPPVM